MQRVLFATVLVVVAFAAGWWLNPQMAEMNSSHSGPEANGEREPLYWVAPMDANYRRDKPGKSPMGMDLVPVYEEESGEQDDGGVSISPRIAASLGVRTAEVSRGALDLPIETVGRVTYDEDQLVHFHSRVSGWIEELAVNATGEPVEKGQPLLALYSPDLVNAQKEFLLTQRLSDRGMKRSARNNLLALGITSRQIDELERSGQVTQRVRIEAPASGFVSSLNVREGMFIKPDTEVLAIGSLDTVWVIGEVFERHAGLVQVGQSVSISMPAFPGEHWTGEVDFIYPELDPQTRTLRVRVRVPNPEGRLRPNMFVELALQAPLGESLLSVPREALIRDGRHPRVIVAEGNGRFRPVLVTPGREAGDRVVIQEGLESGQTVVTSAQFLIDSETNLDAALARLTEQDTGSEPPKVVEVMGEVTGVMPEMGMISLKHAPIPAWDWPTMVMDFEIDEGVSIADVTVGDQVRVSIRDAGDWTYVIEALDQSSGDEGAEADGQGKSVQATGEIREVMADVGLVTIVHDPIPEWQWPRMTMTFEAESDIDLSALKPEQRIQFRLRETAAGDYRLESVQPSN